MINNIPQIALVYDRRMKANAERKASVEIRITHNRKQRYISTGVMLYPKQWKRNVVTGCADAIQLNQLINKMLIDVRTIILEMNETNTLDINLIPERLEQMRRKKENFIEYCQRRSEIRKYGKSPDSKERYDRFIRLFRLWGEIKDFSDVTEANIIKYDKYLGSTGMKPYSKWQNYHRFLNSFILDALNEGLLIRNPYSWVNIERKDADDGPKRHLSPEEFQRIKTAKMPTESMERVRDLFVFQTYTCLSYADLKGFSEDRIIEVRGMKVYTNSREKTSKRFTVPLLSEALSILAKYNGKLPIISNVKYNEYLKVVAQAARIDKPISSHWARHTGATMLLNEGVDMQIVSKICGHSSTKITEQVYAKLLDETVVEAIRNIKEKTS